MGPLPNPKENSIFYYFYALLGYDYFILYRSRLFTFIFDRTRTYRVLGGQLDVVSVEPADEGEHHRVVVVVDLDHFLLVRVPMRLEHAAEVIAPASTTTHTYVISIAPLLVILQ